VSTILKALQRLEEEKSANVERSLNEQVVAHRPPPEPKRRGLRIGAVAIGGLVVAAAALLFWFNREDPGAEVAMESPPPAVASVAAQKAAAEKPRRRPSARPAPAARAQQPSSEVEVSPIVKVVKRLDAPPADSAASAAASAAALAASQKRATPPAQAGAERPGRRPSARKRAQPKPDSQVAREAARPKPALAQVANAESPETPISENSAPALPAPVPPEPVEIAAVAQKPATTATSASTPAAIREPESRVIQRAKIPTLRVEKTIWHPDADRRVVVVKLIDAEEILRLKEGDAVGPLVVKAIKPGSVLFNHDGIEVVYNVGG
jgi:hypothetical protein